MTTSAPSVFDPAPTAEENRALEEAEAAIAAGRTLSHAAVRNWLRSWGKRNERQPPKCGE